MKTLLTFAFVTLLSITAYAEGLPGFNWEAARGWKIAHTENVSHKYRATIERDSPAGWATVKLYVYQSKNNDFIKEAGRILDEAAPLPGLRVYQNADVKEGGVFYVEFIAADFRGCIVGKHMGEYLVLAIGEWPAGAPPGYYKDAVQIVRSVRENHGR